MGTWMLGDDRRDHAGGWCLHKPRRRWRNRIAFYWIVHIRHRRRYRGVF